MTDAVPTPEDEDDALAGEYVLGVLSQDQRLAFAARLQVEPRLLTKVEAWEDRLAGLNDAFAEAQAPKLLPAIEARLFPNAARTRSAARSVGGWLSWLSGAMVAMVLVLGIVALVAPPQSRPIARLVSPDNRLAYEVQVYGEGLKVTRVAGDTAGPGLVHELWLIAPGKGPVSLGLLGQRPLIVDQTIPQLGWTLAISLEPEGGSTMGVPTGPVILSVEIGA